MKTITVPGSDLLVEVWFGGGDDDDGERPLVRVRSLDLEADGQGGAVIVRPEEIRGLVAALVEAAGLLAEETAKRCRLNSA